MLTISAFGMMGMCLSLILRQYNKEMAMMISIVSSILMMLFLLDHIRSFLEMIASYLNRIQGGNLYISILDRLPQQNQSERLEEHAQDSAGG